MARPAASEEARIARLRAALARAVSQGLVAESFNAKQMHELLGVNRTTFRDWTSEPEIAESGAFVAGAEGVDYAFNPIATIWVLIRWFERKRDAKLAEVRRVDEQTGRQKDSPIAAGISAQEARAIQQIKFANINMERECGNLIPKDQVIAALTGQTHALVEGLIGSGTWLDPTSEWPPELRQSHDAACAATIEKVKEHAKKVMAELDGSESDRPAGGNERDRRRAKVR